MDNIKQICIVFCIIVISFMAGLLPCMIGLSSEPDNQPEPIPIIIIPYIEPPQPTGYIFITSNTPCSEPYYVNATPPDFKVGDWVKSNSNYVFFMKDSFNGQVIKINDDVVTVCINNDSYTHVNKYWLMHWDCEMIIHDPDIGYYCYTKLIDGTYCFNENATAVSVIYE